MSTDTRATLREPARAAPADPGGAGPGLVGARPDEP